LIFAIVRLAANQMIEVDSASSGRFFLYFVFVAVMTTLDFLGNVFVTSFSPATK
jgi:hypothetical protein